MSYRSDRAQRLGQLIDQLHFAEYPSVELLSLIGKECDGFSARQSVKSGRINRLISTGAWSDAALSLMEVGLPLWKLRRVTYDDGRWYCAISRQRELPDWLDQAVEADHPNLSLAILSAFAEALMQSSASKPVSVPGASVIDARYEPLDCSNFA